MCRWRCECPPHSTSSMPRAGSTPSCTIAPTAVASPLLRCAALPLASHQQCRHLKLPNAAAEPCLPAHDVHVSWVLTQGWQTAVMSQTSSRARPAGGLWTTAIVPVPQDMAPSACMLDFHISGETPAGASGVRLCCSAVSDCSVAPPAYVSCACTTVAPDIPHMPATAYDDISYSRAGSRSMQACLHR